MKIAITGVKGMLGTELARCAQAAGHTVAGYDLPELDITADFPLHAMDSSCDVLVNCAAYTAVDGAETNRDLAFAVNDEGAGRISSWCKDNAVRMVHISTDYVFDGELNEPYTEDVETNPLSVYGESKLAGEIAVLEESPNALIIRTQALFGPGGKSFPAAIIGKLESGDDALKVVDDQTVCPTCTGHLAEAIMDLIGVAAENLVHVSSSGQCTWYEFSREIAARVKPDAVIEAVGTDAFPLPARRPMHSVLSKSRFEELAGRPMPDWKEALTWYLEAAENADNG